MPGLPLQKPHLPGVASTFSKFASYSDVYFKLSTVSQVVAAAHAFNPRTQEERQVDL